MNSGKKKKKTQQIVVSVGQLLYSQGMVSTFMGVPHCDLLPLTLLPKGKKVFLEHVTLEKVKKKTTHKEQILLYSLI